MWGRGEGSQQGSCDLYLSSHVTYMINKLDSVRGAPVLCQVSCARLHFTVTCCDCAVRELDTPEAVAGCRVDESHREVNYIHLAAFIPEKLLSE